MEAEPKFQIALKPTIAAGGGGVEYYQRVPERDDIRGEVARIIADEDYDLAALIKREPGRRPQVEILKGDVERIRLEIMNGVSFYNVVETIEV